MHSLLTCFFIIFLSYSTFIWPFSVFEFTPFSKAASRISQTKLSNSSKLKTLLKLLASRRYFYINMSCNLNSKSGQLGILPGWGRQKLEGWGKLWWVFFSSAGICFFSPEVAMGKGRYETIKSGLVKSLEVLNIYLSAAISSVISVPKSPAYQSWL